VIFQVINHHANEIFTPEVIHYGIVGTILIGLYSYFESDFLIYLSAIIVNWTMATDIASFIRPYTFWIIVVYSAIAIYRARLSASMVVLLFILNSLIMSYTFVSEIKSTPQKTETIDQVSSVMEDKLTARKLRCDKKEFLYALEDVCYKYNISTNHLLFVMWLESGLNPSAVNSSSQASGLLQFLPSTAKAMNEDHSKIKLMNGKRQLKLVDKYLGLYGSKIEQCDDVYLLYLLIFYPAAISKVKENPDYVFPQAVIDANPTMFSGENNYRELKKYIDKKMLIAGINI